MIFDTLNNCDKYYSCHPKFEAAFNFIRTAIAENLPAESYHLEGAEMYASISEYISKNPDETMFEGHVNYIDIQCVVSGVECMEAVDISKAAVSQPYDSSRDICFYEDSSIAHKATLRAGDFAVFFPHDIHKPGMCLEGAKAAVKKIVVKIHV